MATTVEKRQVRKQQYDEALGIEVPKKKHSKQEKAEAKKKFYSSELFKWGLFFLDILLIIFILSSMH